MGKPRDRHEAKSATCQTFCRTFGRLRLTLLVVTTGDPEDVSLPLVSDGVGGNLLGHPLFDEDSADSPEQSISAWAFPILSIPNLRPPVILEVDELLSAGGGVGDVQLHCGAETTPSVFGSDYYLLLRQIPAGSLLIRLCFAFICAPESTLISLIYSPASSLFLLTAFFL